MHCTEVALYCVFDIYIKVIPYVKQKLRANGRSENLTVGQTDKANFRILNFVFFF